MIADFGLSRVMQEDKLSLLTEICGTPGVSFLLCCLLLVNCVSLDKEAVNFVLGKFTDDTV